MSKVKCLNCKKLIREEILSGGKPAGLYNCLRFPYAVVLGGLFQPGRGIQKAVKECPEACRECVVCGATEDLITYGEQGDTYICKEHDRDWDAWLGSHLDRLEYTLTRHTVISRRWFKVFRQYVESRRQCRICGCTWENPCITSEGACSWLDWNLCSACQEKEK